MRLRSLFFFVFYAFSGHALFSQEMLILFPDTLEAGIVRYASLRRQTGLHVRLSPLQSSRPAGSHDLLQLIREAHDSLALDYVLLAGPAAALPPFRNALGSLSDYPYTLPDSTGPRLAVGRLPVMNRMQLTRYTNRVAGRDKNAAGPKVLILPGRNEHGRAEAFQRSLSARGISSEIIGQAAPQARSCGLFVYIGQGSSRAWLDAGINTLTADSLFRISASVILGIACSTAAIAESHSLAMKLLFDHKGPLHLIGCAGNCLLDESARMGSFIIAQWEAGKPIGDMLKEAERAYLRQGGNAEKMEHTLGEFLLWGDPSLVPFTENSGHEQRK